MIHEHSQTSCPSEVENIKCPDLVLITNAVFFAARDSLIARGNYVFARDPSHRYTAIVTNSGHATLSDVRISDPSLVSGTYLV